MASLGHVIIGFAGARWLYQRALIAPAPEPLRPWMVGLAGLSLLPDADVLGFSFGVRYAAPWGHRGASHSLLFSLALGAFVFALVDLWARSRSEPPPWRGRSLPVVLVFAAIALSHGLLDCLTDGGHGIALLWPFSNERFFAPWQPIPVAPIGRRFLSARGLECFLTELAWFSPLLAYAWWPRRGAEGGASAPRGSEETGGELD